MLRQERRFMNRYGRIIYEDILHFRNVKNNSSACRNIIDSASCIAEDMLREKLTAVNDKALPLLKEAISRRGSVKPSERLSV